MAIIQCKNNHYYDGDKYTQCPHCISGMEKNDMNEGVTVPMGNTKVEEYLAQYVKSHPSEEMENEEEKKDLDEGKTIALVTESRKNVCGWLVQWLLAVLCVDLHQVMCGLQKYKASRHRQGSCRRILQQEKSDWKQ